MRSPSTSFRQDPSAQPVGDNHDPEGLGSNERGESRRGGGTSSRSDLYSPQQMKIA